MKLVVADSNAIEARMLAWFAGHEPLVEGFRLNKDIYSGFASKVYGRPVNRKLKLPDGSMPDKIPGHVGKVAILGLGYQMGPAKFAATLAAGPMGEDPIIFTAKEAESMGVRVEDYAVDPDTVVRDAEGKLPWHLRQKTRLYAQLRKMPSRLALSERLIHGAVCAYLVRVYRADNEPIKELWGEMVTVLEAMADRHEAAFGPNDCVQTVKEGLLGPTGLVMHYRGLERRTTVDEETGEEQRGFVYLAGRGGKRTHIYGGKLVENIIQWLARCVIAEQALRFKATGRRIVTTTHDEIVSATRDADAEGALGDLIQIMKTPPKWAEGCPLNAEGGIAQSYGEAK
jgi:hypothetical protein